MERSGQFVTPFDFGGRLPLRQAIPLGLQHVLAMFVGNLTPILIITNLCAATSGAEDFAAIQVVLLQNAMLVAGLVTLVQLFAIGPVGGKVPIIMGTSSGFIGVFQSVVNVMGGGIVAYGAIMGASILGGLFETVLGAFLKPLRRFFPSVVTGTVVLSIGLSLISVGVGSFGGGTSAKDYGSVENLLIALAVMIIVLALKHGAKGLASSSCILIGIVCGYIICAILPLFLSTTGVTADGVEYTKAWVLNWDKVAQASWVSIPALMPVKPVFDLRAILPVMIMFIVTAVETVGDISGVMEGGMGREATDQELAGGVMCDGLGSSFAALFGVLPNTSFSQNVGLVAMTKVVNRFGLRRCVPGAVWPAAQAGGHRVHHASERAGRCSGHHVLLHRDERYPAHYQGAPHRPEHVHRLGGSGSGLRPGRQQRGALRPASVDPAGLRRLRHRARRLRGHYHEHPAA